MLNGIIVDEYSPTPNSIDIRGIAISSDESTIYLSDNNVGRRRIVSVDWTADPKVETEMVTGLAAQPLALLVVGTTLYVALANNTIKSIDLEDETPVVSDFASISNALTYMRYDSVNNAIIGSGGPVTEQYISVDLTTGDETFLFDAPGNLFYGQFCLEDSNTFLQSVTERNFTSNCGVARIYLDQCRMEKIFGGVGQGNTFNSDPFECEMPYILSSIYKSDDGIIHILPNLLGKMLTLNELTNTVTEITITGDVPSEQVPTRASFYVRRGDNIIIAPTLATAHIQEMS